MRCDSFIYNQIVCSSDCSPVAGYSTHNAFVIDKLSGYRHSVGESEFAKAITLALLESAFVDRSVRILQHTLAVRFLVAKVAPVLADLQAVYGEQAAYCA